MASKKSFVFFLDNPPCIVLFVLSAKTMRVTLDFWIRGSSVAMQARLPNGKKSSNARSKTALYTSLGTDICYRQYHKR